MDIINSGKRQKIKCPNCGRVVSKGSYYIHLKSLYCLSARKQEAPKTLEERIDKIEYVLKELHRVIGQIGSM